jgi:DNA polymerase (family X)
MATETHRMTNEELAKIFERIGSLMEIKGEVIYKTLAYRRAAESLRALADDINFLRQEGRLLEIPGVGKAIAEKITELLDTGRLGFLDELEEEVPGSLVDLLEVTDVGPKKAALFWKQLGVTNLPELEAAAREGRLRTLPGMGEKSEARIVAGIEALSRRSTRMLLGTAWPIARRWMERLRALPEVVQIEAAGSLRRWRSTIGDIDLAAASYQPEVVMKAFLEDPEVLRVLGQGENKSSIELATGTKLQLWVQPPERFGTLLVYATGSKDHNVRLRELAQRKGLSLSEQCFVDGAGNETLCASEEQVYDLLGLAWIPPEMREDRGEVQAAQKHALPGLVSTDQVLSELHSHSTWSDGSLSLLEMAQEARRRGRSVLAITDHTVSLGIANGLDAARLAEQRKEIDAAQETLGDSIRLLQGAEVEIKADGSLDLPDEVLARLDIVIASLHVSLRQPREQVTQRLLNAIRNPYVDIIGHPSGRLLPNREGADLDWDAVLQAARENRVALEINASPSRLDLDEIYARRAAEMGIPISIDTDAHSPGDFDNLPYGVSVARRAWVGPENIINTWTVDRLVQWLHPKGK